MFCTVTATATTPPPASTVSTQLLMVGICLAVADIPGVAGALTLGLTPLLLPHLVYACRRRLLTWLLPLGQLLTTKPTARGNLCIGRIKTFFKFYFSAFSQFIEVFQLQSSKVGGGWRNLSYG